MISRLQPGKIGRKGASYMTAYVMAPEHEPQRYEVHGSELREPAAAARGKLQTPIRKIILLRAVEGSVEDPHGDGDLQ